MRHNDGIRSYTAPPVGARVCEKPISEPTAVCSSTEKGEAFLRSEITALDACVVESQLLILAAVDSAWTAEMTHDDDYLVELRDDYRSGVHLLTDATTNRRVQRAALQAEIRELRKERRPDEGRGEETPASFGDHYDGCDGCRHPQCNGMSW